MEVTHITSEKLKKILAFNEKNEKEIQNRVQDFYDENHIKPGIRDIITFAKTMIAGKDVEILQIPLKDKEIGALYHEINGKKYIVLNTSLNLANNNFALAHELYHLYFHEKDSSQGDTERYLMTYQDNTEDMMANAFAGNILMPEQEFTEMYLCVQRIVRQIEVGNGATESPEELDILCIIILLMIQFKTTYMSVVIRLSELGLLQYNNMGLIKKILQCNSNEFIREIINRIPKLKSSVAEYFYPVMNDDFKIMYEFAKENAQKSVDAEIMDESYMDYNLSLLEKMYKKVAIVGNKADDYGAF